MGPRIEKEVVESGDDHVGDLVELAERLGGLLEVFRLGEHLPGEEMVEGGDGATREQEGQRRGGDEEPAVAARVAGQREEVHLRREPILGGSNPLDCPQFLANVRSLHVAVELLKKGPELRSHRVDLFLAGKDLRGGECPERGAMGRAKAGEEDGVNPVWSKAGPFEQPRDQRRRRKSGIDENRSTSGANERAGRMGSADRLRLVPEEVATERADADDVDADGHGAKVSAIG